MKTLLKRILLTCLMAFLMIFILIHGKTAKEFAYLGLMTWYEQMIPTLLPFMIFSSILIKLDLVDILMKPFSKILKPIFRVNSYCIYVIVMGFLCGFPMGAKNCATLYKNGKLTKYESEFLLAFTNNISPTYFFTFVLANIYEPKSVGFSVFLMYGLPLLYGFLLRHTVYKHKISCLIGQETMQNSYISSSRSPKRPSLFEAIDESINSSLLQIAMLGGYMILFNLLVLIPFTLLKGQPEFYGILHSILEITGGFAIIKHQTFSLKAQTLIVHGVLSFNGLCCFAQTTNILNGTNLSIRKYFINKLILCMATLIIILVIH